MNCKPGDLAFVVEDDFPEVVGRIVEVVEFAGEWPFDPRPHWLVKVQGSPIPVFETSEGWRTGSVVYDTEVEFPDSDLRPIRPSDISDEEVRELYAPKLPEKQPA